MKVLKKHKTVGKLQKAGSYEGKDGVSINLCRYFPIL